MLGFGLIAVHQVILLSKDFHTYEILSCFDFECLLLWTQEGYEHK